MQTKTSTSTLKSFKAPKIGQYWPGQGGIYIGQMLDGDTQIALIMATQAFKGTWGEYPNLIPGEFSRTNGQHNAQLMLAAEPENKLVLEIAQHEADGHRDFYFPAEFENNLICINAREHIEETWHWSSTQYSAHSAWDQDFVDGFQGFNGKYGELAVRAVRRLIIQ